MRERDCIKHQPKSFISDLGGQHDWKTFSLPWISGRTFNRTTSIQRRPTPRQNPGLPTLGRYEKTYNPWPDYRPSQDSSNLNFRWSSMPESKTRESACSGRSEEDFVFTRPGLEIGQVILGRSPWLFQRLGAWHDLIGYVIVPIT